MERVIEISLKAIEDRFGPQTPESIQEHLDDVRDGAREKGVSMFQYIKDTGAENIARAVLMHRIIDLLDAKHNMCNHQLLPDSATDVIKHLAHTSPYMANAYCHNNIIRDGNKIGRLGFIINGKPSWVKPVPGSYILFIKVDGVEVDYFCFWQMLAHERPWLRSDAVTRKVLSLLKSPLLNNKLRDGELIYLVSNAACPDQRGGRADRNRKGRPCLAHPTGCASWALRIEDASRPGRYTDSHLTMDGQIPRQSNADII